MNPRNKAFQIRGAALVIVLAFVVLLTGLVVAYFSRTMTNRQLSNSSFNQVKADQLAMSAADVIVGDLKQEIAAGSTVTTVGTAPNQSKLYLPTANANMVPKTSGTPAAADTPIPNLVRRSIRNESIIPPSPLVNSKASAVSSATDPSVSGRTISTTRWNKHYLAPKKVTTNDETVPVDSFLSPDWVIVTSNGPTAFPTWDATLKSPTNANYAVGRYAYAVYDEGGLIDINSVGFPSPAPAGTPYQAYRGSMAFVNLDNVTTTGTGTVSDSQVNKIIGWRNYASTQPSGVFHAFTFDTAALTRYVTSSLTRTDGLRNVSSTTWNGRTDQMFTSRQQMIAFKSASGTSGGVTSFPVNAFQYLTTFSRGLEQPSFIPNASRPKIMTGAIPAANAANSYLGNNNGTGGDNALNPSFLNVRVTNTGFTRFDGSTPVPGEPLVKTRFPLNRLAWITYEGPSADASAGTKSALLALGIPQATIDAGNAANIQKYFGLSWTAASSSWTYKQENNDRIKNLAAVPAATREPDFFELLKAAIHAGSIAKGGPNLHNDQDNYQYTLDVSVDYNILQIGANLIDQFDPDSYPTAVQIASGTTPSFSRVFRGIEDIPYFYRYHRFAVVTDLPSPLLSRNEVVNFPPGTTGYPGATPYAFKGARVGTLSSPGSASILYIPEVWNPHDAMGRLAATGPRPTKFQVVAETRDPAAQTGAWEIGAMSLMQNYSTAGGNIVPSTEYPMSMPPTAPLAGTMQFSDVNGSLYREPTLLWRTDFPTGANITSPTTVTDANTNKTYTGILVGKCPASMQKTIDSTTYVFQGNGLATPTKELASSGKAQVTFRLQYWNGSTWVTYDEKYPDLHVPGEPKMTINKTDFSSNLWMNPYSNDAFERTATSYDPRTARFGVGTANDIGAGSPKKGLVEVDGNDNSAVGSSNFTVLETQRPRADRGSKVLYSNPGMTSDPGMNKEMRFFPGKGYSGSNGDNTATDEFDGLWSQNNPAVLTLARDGTNKAFYYEDADGIARRGTSAYADGTLTATAPIVGFPHAIANTYGSDGVGTPTAQSQSRPLVLNRPFRSVAEMSYASRGGIWKNIDFFTPESGDTALLDVFCINEIPSSGIVAGKVNLNTRQAPVLKAILAGAYREELTGTTGLPTGYATSTLNSSGTSDEANAIANKLINITSNSTNKWEGPLSNVSEIVGRYVPAPGTTTGATDVYSFTEPVTNTTYTFAGLSAALDASAYLQAALTAPAIQRLRESAIRPLASIGQTRVWNLMIDVIAQSGRYPSNATSLPQFFVEGEKRYWVHVAIDRYTGEVIDKQTELVTE